MADKDAHDALRETPLGTLRTPKIATEMNLVTIPGTDPTRVEGVYDAPGDLLCISTSTPSP